MYRQHLIDMYLDYVNNFLTVERFANYYGLMPDDAQALLKVCRSVFETKHPEA